MAPRWVHAYARAFREAERQLPDGSLDAKYARTSEILRERQVETFARSLSGGRREQVSAEVQAVIDRIAQEPDPKKEDFLAKLKSDIYFITMAEADEDDRALIKSALDVSYSAKLVRATIALVVVTALLVLATLALVLVELLHN